MIDSGLGATQRLAFAEKRDIIWTDMREETGMNESQAIETVVHLYVEGMTFAHEAALRKAFHPRASIVGNYEGKVEWLSLDEFIAALVAEGAAPAGVQPMIQIEALDITGDTANVKVVDEFAGMRFSDYLSLLKIGSHWVIVGKLYHLHS